MSCYRWNQEKQAFVTVVDPLEDGASMEDSLSKFGYVPELSSQGERDAGSGLTVYVTENKTKPTYYIDVMGECTGIASFVAHDFLEFLETLKQIDPLMSLMRMNQYSVARVSDHLDADPRY